MRTAICSYCGAEFTRKKLGKAKSGHRFCNRTCKTQAQRIGGIREIMPSHYGTTSSDYRDIALRNLPHRCVSCGYDETTKMLDVDHIDENRKNNDISNLQFLCVWCHALKTRRDWKD